MKCIYFTLTVLNKSGQAGIYIYSMMKSFYYFDFLFFNKLTLIIEVKLFPIRVFRIIRNKPFCTVRINYYSEIQEYFHS
ncbi:MAG TPA: hypothetical protein DF409_03320 [Bacteroidales bacterium]|jgi:hypothetical protein|nr:hypothetical protein [Bacteroidales bacterium]